MQVVRPNPSRDLPFLLWNRQRNRTAWWTQNQSLDRPLERLPRSCSRRPSAKRDCMPSSRGQFHPRFRLRDVVAQLHREPPLPLRHRKLRGRLPVEVLYGFPCRAAHASISRQPEPWSFRELPARYPAHPPEPPRLRPPPRPRQWTQEPQETQGKVMGQLGRTQSSLLSTGRSTHVCATCKNQFGSNFVVGQCKPMRNCPA